MSFILNQYQQLLFFDGKRKMKNNTYVLQYRGGGNETEKEKIFERFYRSDESRSRETGGYGLGLAIAKSIIQQHGGKIKVTTKAGEWIRFMIKL